MSQKDQKGITTGSSSRRWSLTRREFLKASGSFITVLITGLPFASARETKGITRLRFGIVTDAHYADVPGRGARYYKESIFKMDECVSFMNDQQVGFLIELGDFKDQEQPPTEKDTLEYLDRIEKVYSGFRGKRFHVLGNHDVDSISKEQFLSGVVNTGMSPDAKYYSFEIEGMHFVVLDANYRKDGSDYDHGNFNWTDTNIPEEEIRWLKADLASTSSPVVVFVHQQLDGEGSHTINNAAEVREVLMDSGRVLGVFQGHNHAGYYSHIDGIHYYTLKAMVDGSGAENNSYAIVEVLENNDMVVKGYHQAVSKNL